MKKNVQKFEELCMIINDPHVFHDPDTNFEELCRQVGADPTDMNNLFYENFGMSAEEMIYSFKTGNMRIKI